MKKIIFVTNNPRKIEQTQAALEKFGVTVEQRAVDIMEIQAHDPLDIAKAKARAAFDVVGEPIIVGDDSWSIPALKGFPGGYANDINKWFETEDWLALMKEKTDRTQYLTETIVYFDGQTMEIFSEQFTSRFIDEPRGTGHHAVERVTVFEGSDLTIAEAIDTRVDSRDLSKSAMSKFGEWYSKQNGQ